MSRSPSPPGPSSPASPSGKRWPTAAIAVLVALSVVLAGVLGYELGRGTSSSSPASASGPLVSVHAEGRDPGGHVENLSGVVVDMFSVLPLALERPMVGLNLVSLPVKDNPYFVQLGSGTTD